LKVAVDMDAENGIEFWLHRKTTYKFIEPCAVDLLSASASQIFVDRENLFSVWSDDSRSQ